MPQDGLTMSETSSTPGPAKGQPALAQTLKALAARLESGPQPDLDEMSEALYAIRSGDFDKATKKMLLDAREGVDEGKSPDSLVMRMLAKAVIAMPGVDREDRITPVRGVPVVVASIAGEVISRFVPAEAAPLPAPPAEDESDRVVRLDEAGVLVEPEPDLSPAEREIMRVAPTGKKRGRPPGKKNGNGNGNGYIDPLPPVPFEPESLPEEYLAHESAHGFAPEPEHLPYMKPILFDPRDTPRAAAPGHPMEYDPDMPDHELVARAAELLGVSHASYYLDVPLYDLAERLQRTPLSTDEPLLERAERAIEAQISRAIESGGPLPPIVLEWVKWKRDSRVSDD